jgi:SAM-dependent methyltransferase
MSDVVRDVLLYGMNSSSDFAALLEWSQTTDGVSFRAPDPHRLQLEHWVWSHRAMLGRDVLDVGVIERRAYFGTGYVTCGESTEDVRGDLCALPFPDARFDGIVLTEVLEHCQDPVSAMREVLRVLKPGGLALVTSPFLWPWHGTQDYRDYWRFTHQGWELLLKDFASVTIQPCAMTAEAKSAYDIMRRFECMGFASDTLITTAYLCTARKAVTS